MKPLSTLLLSTILLAGVSCGKSNEGTDQEENEREIQLTELPEAVSSKLSEEHPDAVLKEADEITKEDGSKTYDIEVEINGRTLEYMYDAEGNYLGEEIDDEDDGDDEEDDD